MLNWPYGSITQNGEITQKRKRIQLRYFFMRNKHMKFQDTNMQGSKNVGGIKSVTERWKERQN